MSSFIRTSIWNHLKVNQFLYRSSPVSLSRKSVNFSQQFSNAIRQIHSSRPFNEAAHTEISVNNVDEKELEMSIDKNQVGRFIGRRGMNIRQIAKVSNCRISLDDAESMDDAGNLMGKRLVSIVGESERDIAEAKRVIEELLTNENAFLNEALECEIPKSLIGRLLGKDGWNVNRLSDDHDCRIQIAHTEDGEENVKVQFFGGVENCTEARNALLVSLDLMSSHEGTEISLSVPEHLAGLLIGQSGATINVLKRLTKCELAYESRESDQEIYQSQDRTLTIRGSDGDCEDAKTVITALLNLFKRHKDAGELV